MREAIRRPAIIANLMRVGGATLIAMGAAAMFIRKSQTL